jgi:hypothetical protein
MTISVPNVIKHDAETSTHFYLLKHVYFLRLTNQIQMLLYKALVDNKKIVLITPKACILSQDLIDFIYLHKNTLTKRSE